MRPERRAGISAAVALALVTALHLRALDAVPLARIGRSGAEYVPHVQRQLAEAWLAGRGAGALLNPWGALRALDGHYGGLLHLLAALWAQLPGAPTEGPQVFAWASHLMLLALAVLGLSLWRLGAHAAPDAAALALLMPGLFAASRHYYYDLPMTACLMASAALLLTSSGLRSPGRAALAGLLLGAALLFKWAAALYAAPVGLLALYLQREAPPRALVRGLAAGVGAAALAAAPVMGKAGGSFAFQLGLVGAGAGAEAPVGRAAIYARSLIFDGLGPALSVGVALALVLALGSITRDTLRAPRDGAPRGDAPRAGRLLLAAALVVGAPLLYVLLRVPAPNGRYLMPLLPWLALGLAAALRALGRWTSRALTGLLLACALVGVASVEGKAPSVAQAEAELAALQPWRAWWWTGARLDVAAPIEATEAAVGAALDLANGPQALLRGQDDTLSPHAWQYHLERLAPGTQMIATGGAGMQAALTAVADGAAVVVSAKDLPLAASWVGEPGWPHLYTAAQLSAGAATGGPGPSPTGAQP